MKGFVEEDAITMLLLFRLLLPPPPAGTFGVALNAVVVALASITLFIKSSERPNRDSSTPSLTFVVILLELLLMEVGETKLYCLAAIPMDVFGYLMASRALKSLIEVAGYFREVA